MKRLAAPRRSSVAAGTLPVAGLLLACGVLGAQEIGWFAYGRDIEGTRYFPAADITRENVGRLELAWTYRTGESEPRFATKKPTSLEATRRSSSTARCTSARRSDASWLWIRQPVASAGCSIREIKRDVTYGDFASRGVSSWLDGSAPADAACRQRILSRRRNRSSSLSTRAPGSRCRGVRARRHRGSQGRTAHSAV